jgi:hypothetical protein
MLLVLTRPIDKLILCPILIFLSLPSLGTGGAFITSPAAVMISLYRTPSDCTGMVSALCTIILSLVSLLASAANSLANLKLSLWFDTTPAVYARLNFGILGLRLLRLRDRDFFHAAAAIDVGVLGVMGLSCSSFSCLCLSLGFGVEPKGSEDRNESFAFDTIFERLSLRDFWTGRDMLDVFE